MSQIDVPIATEILALLDEPALAEEEQRLAELIPAVASEELLDRALQAALLHLRYTVNRQTFEYLRWKVVITRETARRTLESARVARAERDATAQDVLSRQFFAADFTGWTVTEIAGNVLARPGQRCLIFASADTVRRVWSYPADWRELSDMKLEALSWQH
ncbi:MAG: hypothetical protein JWN53_778 [Gemmatimonadetes bacterium]|jgi:hypothetical protein|nr:hypothetical protein [Gemmatimonadota bacterium]